MKREMLHDSLAEVWRAKRAASISAIESLEDDEKQVVSESFQSFTESMKQCSNVITRRFEEGKAFKVSETSITSLDELTSLTHGMSLQEQKPRSQKNDKIIDIISSAIISKVRAEAAKEAEQQPDHGKMPSVSKRTKTAESIS